jgi:hypothetical protein
MKFFPARGTKFRGPICLYAGGPLELGLFYCPTYPYFTDRFGRYKDVIRSHKPKLKNMKRILVAAIVIITSTILFSCNRSVTPFQAANSHYSRCRDMR